MVRVLSPRESAAQAIGKFIVDFRHWLVPETRLLSRWKSQQHAYYVAEGRMVDDAPALIDSLRKAEAAVPMLVFAMKQVTAPPDLSQVIGMPFEKRVIIPTDPEKRQVIMRTEPRTYHVQLMFLTNDSDSAHAFASQFCSYIRLIEKRRIHVEYHLSPGITQPWHLTILDNSIYPDEITIEEANLKGALVDFDFSGLVPRVLKGLPPLYPEEFGPGSNLGGDTNNPNIPNRPGENPNGELGIVVQVDTHADLSGRRFVRGSIDPETRIITEEYIYL
ncbi:hypothetical protein [Acinetobacter indicus]|uniref:hypothetical protein n=1 Tax=Acinetobacter indicus TaxID=756892 RepID=UPI00209B221B|nr:hypothetical protein [Acinetobacter indicus]MCO8088186.1 hypothetical protein [Acinetobacter indicus]